MRKISIEDALNLPTETKSKLIKSDPVTVVLYFEEMLLNIKHVLQNPEGPFKGKYVVDYYIRREFQNRSSVHAHMLFWLKDPPKYEKDSSNHLLIQFIDRIITCEYDPENPLMSLQRHKHTHTCYKRGKKKCRFHFPKYVMPKTTILEPLKRNDFKDDEEWVRINEILKKINEKMICFFKTNIKMDFDEILHEIGISENDYMKAVRTTIKSSTTFLKRSSLEVSINAYNFHILHMIQSNMDIQFILNPYACISYITDYIGNTGLSKLLRNALKSMENDTTGSISDKLQKFANEFIQGNLITAQFLLILKKIADRSRMLKNKDKLEKLADDSEDIFEKNILEYYAQRNKAFEDVCLADYVTGYKDNVVKNKVFYADKSNRRNVREKRKVLKYCRFKEDNEADFYREQILLFLPWRDEKKEVEEVNHKELFFLKSSQDYQHEKHFQFNKPR